MTRFGSQRHRKNEMQLSGQDHVPAALPPEKNPPNHCIEGLVGLRAGLDILYKRNISFL
jgi:hypothetical protein